MRSTVSQITIKAKPSTNNVALVNLKYTGYTPKSINKKRQTTSKTI
ncbi:MAG: hypothetical protein WCL18_02335 [bacterium]